MLNFDQLNLSKCADGLLPVVVQDATTLRVLMLGYMNREAFEKTQAEGRVTFYSRTRQKLWTKGETSGHYLLVEKMYVDCDADTLLVMAHPIGPTCHRGTTACLILQPRKALSALWLNLFTDVTKRCPRVPTLRAYSLKA